MDDLCSQDKSYLLGYCLLDLVGKEFFAAALEDPNRRNEYRLSEPASPRARARVTPAPRRQPAGARTGTIWPLYVAVRTPHRSEPILTPLPGSSCTSTCPPTSTVSQFAVSKSIPGTSRPTARRSAVSESSTCGGACSSLQEDAAPSGSRPAPASARRSGDRARCRTLSRTARVSPDRRSAICTPPGPSASSAAVSGPGLPRSRTAPDGVRPTFWPTCSS